VDTAPELAQRNAANLATTMIQVNDAKKLARGLPSESEIAGRAEQAKGMERALEY